MGKSCNFEMLAIKRHSYLLLVNLALCYLSKQQRTAVKFTAVVVVYIYIERFLLWDNVILLIYENLTFGGY